MSRDKVYILVAMLVGFAVGCAIIHAAGGQPLAVMRPSVDMAVQYRPALAPQFKFMQPMLPMRARASNVVANAESEAEMGRRKMMGGAFGLAAAINRAAVAEDTDAAARFDKVYGEAYVEKALPPAGDFTRFDKVQTVKRPSTAVAVTTPQPGSVAVEPALIPGVIAFSALVTAGIPALLSPGEKAKAAQDAQRGRQVGKSRKQTTVKKNKFR